MRPDDTSPEAWNVWLNLVRNMTAPERLERALALSALVRRLGEAGIREAHPDACDREIFLRVAQRQLGEELFRKAYGTELDAYGSAERHA